MAENDLPQTSPITLGWLWAQLDEEHRKDALKNLAEWGQKYYDTVMKSAVDALGLVTPPEDERLGYYYTKPLNDWEETRAKFPADFEDQQRDFQRLREKEAKGDLVAKRPIVPAEAVQG